MFCILGALYDKIRHRMLERSRDFESVQILTLNSIPRPDNLGSFRTFDFPHMIRRVHEYP